MHSPIKRLITIATGFLLPFATVGSAQAGLEDCGNIEIEARAECQVELDTDFCQVNCEPVSFEAACAADLRVDCEGQCDVEIEAGCTAECEGSCQAECEVDPGEFDCEAYCEGGCDADCSAKCEAANNRGECEASCKAHCSGECNASCEATPPSASCEASCEASCSGECKAEANAECELECHADGYAECKADLQGGCEAACREPEGALFCDSQYIDHGGSLEDCKAALEEELNIDVKTHASGNADCSGNACEAEGEASASASCAVGRSQGYGGRGGMTLLGGVFALVLLRRRLIGF